jgi:hypothetical protein
MSTLSKSEKEDLQRLVRQREKVLKSAAAQRSAELLADFENQMGQQYRPVDDKVFERAAKEAEQTVEKANRTIAARCRELGIPAGFAPEAEFRWHRRGYDNMFEGRKKELRNMAMTRIAAIEAKAVTMIEMSCLQAQTEIATASLTSDKARALIDKLPPVETMMPMLSYQEIAGEADPPVAKQLVSSNALRQRRFREKQRVTSQGNAVTSRNGNGVTLPKPAAESEDHPTGEE